MRSRVIAEFVPHEDYAPLWNTTGTGVRRSSDVAVNFNPVPNKHQVECLGVVLPLVISFQTKQQCLMN